MRIKSAKVRLQERARKNQEEGAEEVAKEKKLAEIEDRVMTEEDLDTLTQLSEQEGVHEGCEATCTMREATRGSQDLAVYEEILIDVVH